MPPATSSGRAAPSLEPVTGADGVWLQDSSVNLMVINAVFTVDRIDAETLLELWDRRVMQVDGGRRYPRFKKRIVRQGHRFYWQDDPSFDLRHHIREVDGALDGIGAAVRTKEQLQEYVAEIASQPLPHDRPRWQMLLIPDFGDENASAVIYRIHHCMGDGIALIPVLFSLMDAAPEGGGVVMPAVIDRGGKPPNKLLLVLNALLAGPFLLIRKLLWRRDRSVLHGPPCGGDKRVSWTGPIDLERIKAAKNVLGATVNDVLVACVAGGFRRYVAGRGEELRQLRVSMPINVRSRFEELRMDNKFAAVLIPLPVTAAGVRERIAATKAQMDRLKRSIEPFFTYAVVNLLLKLLPPFLSRWLIDFLANKCSCVLTNVPGPQIPVYLAGRRLRAMLFWVPQRSNIGLGISILTLSGSLRIGVIADVDLVPDPQNLVAAFEAELADLRQLIPPAPAAQ